MTYLFGAIVRLVAGLVGLVFGLIGLVLGGTGSMLGLGFALTILLFIPLAIILSPWLLLGLIAWGVWRALGGRRYRRGTWYVVR